MNIFRLTLVIMILGILLLTFNAINTQGLNFFKYVTLTGWQGQFNFDFSCYLLISAFWIAWRHNFSSKGIILGLIASFGGIIFFAPYIFILSLETKGNIKELLIGNN